MTTEARVERTTPVPFHLQEQRFRAEGRAMSLVVWPAEIQAGTKFVITNDRGDAVIAHGEAKVEHVTVRFEPHTLEAGYYYRIKPVLAEPTAAPPEPEPA
jgi:hypothetical protein